MTSIACRTFRCSHLPSLEDDRIQDSKTPAPGQIEALDNALNPGHNLYDAITKSSFTNAQIDMLELQEECYSEAMPSGERKEELERQNSKWTKMKARMKQVGSKQSIGLGSEQKAELVQKVLEVSVAIFLARQRVWALKASQACVVALQARAEVGTRKFLQVFRRLLENSGKVFPDVTITYRDLQVEADALVGTGAINSIGNSLKQVSRRCSQEVCRDPCTWESAPIATVYVEC